MQNYDSCVRRKLAPPTAVLVCFAIVASLSGCAGGDTDRFPRPAVDVPSFALATIDAPTSENNLASLSQTGDLLQFTASNATLHDGNVLQQIREAAPVSATELAVLGDSSIAIVTAEGVERSAPCLECSGLAVRGDRIATVRDNHAPGRDFDIVEFDLDLQVAGRTPAPFAVERVLPGDRLPIQASMLGVNSSDQYVISHISVGGGGRGGPDVVGLYSPEGELIEFTHSRGRIVDIDWSRDRALFATLGRSSGGACASGFYISVFDSETLRSITDVSGIDGASTDHLASSVGALAWSDQELRVEISQISDACESLGAGDLRIDLETGLYTLDELGETSLQFGSLSPHCTETLAVDLATDTFSLNGLPVPEVRSLHYIPWTERCDD